MGKFDFFKHKCGYTRKGLTLEDCIVNMFSSSGISPNREGNKFATEVEGKHCVFNVALTCIEGNSLLVYVSFPIPVDANVAFAANYEVKRIGKEAAGVLPEAQVYLSEKEDGYNIIVATVKEFEELSDNTSDEIRNIMIHSVGILDDKNFASLAASIFGYKTYEDAKMNMQAKSTGGNNVSIQLKDGYHELLNKTPNLSNSRYGGRLMAYAIHIINKNDDNEVAERAAEALQISFDSFVQVVYDVADEEERDLMRKLRFLTKAKNEDDTNVDDFERGKMDGLVICNGNPWNLLYEVGNTDDTDMSEEERLYKRLCAPQYKDYPYEQRDLGEGMTLVNQVIGEYWKPRYLMDNEAKCAYEFMSIDEVLQIVTDEDIDWDSLIGLPQDAFERAKAHSFHFPGHVYQYKNGVAEVEWQLNPDGMYYRDEDGFGLTDDEEINLYGAIDRKGKVVKKFTLKR
jgi:hypothetical protein